MTYLTQSIKVLAATVALVLPALAFAAEPAMDNKGMLIDHHGMTLYTFGDDTGGKSMCNGQCATNWPPLMAKDSDKPMGEWTVITRDDGTKQWAYKGKPLYTYIKDKEKEEKSGDGLLQGKWKAATTHN